MTRAFPDSFIGATNFLWCQSSPSYNIAFGVVRQTINHSLHQVAFKADRPQLQEFKYHTAQGDFCLRNLKKAATGLRSRFRPWSQTFWMGSKSIKNKRSKETWQWLIGSKSDFSVFSNIGVFVNTLSIFGVFWALILMCRSQISH